MRNEKLIVARKERGWTQEKAAEKIGVSRITYARWEARGTIPHLSTISMASAAFNMPPDQLGFSSSIKNQPLESDEDMDRRQALQEIGKDEGNAKRERTGQADSELESWKYTTEVQELDHLFEQVMAALRPNLEMNRDIRFP